MLFCVLVVCNLDLLTHSRHRRQEIDARDMADRGRIYKPSIFTTFLLHHIPTFRASFQKDIVPVHMVLSPKTVTQHGMSVSRSSSSFQNLT